MTDEDPPVAGWREAAAVIEQWIFSSPGSYVRPFALYGWFFTIDEKSSPVGFRLQRPVKPGTLLAS